MVTYNENDTNSVAIGSFLMSFKYRFIQSWQISNIQHPLYYF